MNNFVVNLTVNYRMVEVSNYGEEEEEENKQNRYGIKLVFHWRCKHINMFSSIDHINGSKWSRSMHGCLAFNATYVFAFLNTACIDTHRCFSYLCVNIECGRMSYCLSSSNSSSQQLKWNINNVQLRFSCCYSSKWGIKWQKNMDTEFISTKEIWWN